MKRVYGLPSHILLTLLTVSCCVGCGGGDKVDLGAVSGVVTMDGEPLSDVIVVFSPEDGNPSSGLTDSEGKYSLSYLGKSDGAIIGKHKVSITTADLSMNETELDSGDADLANADLLDTTNISSPPPEDGDVTKRQPRIKAKIMKEPIPSKYNAKSSLTADVQSGENTFDFQLDSN